MARYDSVLFDSDGVLVTPPSIETQSAATREAFREVGVDEVDQGYVDELVSGVNPDRLRAICGAVGLEAATFWQVWERRDEQSQLAAFEDGTRTPYDDLSVIERLAQRVAVVSNNHHSTIEFVLEHIGLAAHVDVFYGRENTVESLGLQKPNTHYIERALAHLETESGIYVGDSQHDVVAAHRSGLDSVFLRRDHCRDVDLAVEPTYEIESLDELSGVLDGSTSR